VAGIQWFPVLFSSLSALYLILQITLSGPVNIAAPAPVTNSEFAKTLAHTLHRPALVNVPEFAVKLMFGEMGEELLLRSIKAVPSKLLKAGFSFNKPTLESTFKNILVKH